MILYERKNTLKIPKNKQKCIGKNMFFLFLQSDPNFSEEGCYKHYLVTVKIEVALCVCLNYYRLVSNRKQSYIVYLNKNIFFLVKEKFQ